MFYQSIFTCLLLRILYYSGFLTLYRLCSFNILLTDLLIKLINIVINLYIKSRANILTRVQSKAYTESSSFSSLPYSKDIHYFSRPMTVPWKSFGIISS